MYYSPCDPPSTILTAGGKSSGRIAPTRGAFRSPSRLQSTGVYYEYFNYQRIIQPPSISTVWPVMKEEASEERKATRLPMSSGVPRRLMDCCSRTQRL